MQHSEPDMNDHERKFHLACCSTALVCLGPAQNTVIRFADCQIMCAYTVIAGSMRTELIERCIMTNFDCNQLRKSDDVHQVRQQMTHWVHLWKATT